ncbi:hypothetical protein SVAN01_02218 [Stagonosporopsis vannaccii]|nr:hypothetical protein SVAN01_02218 [Stagonosporopsis vannaccii]
MEDFDENDEMAAVLGFSQFGGTKKRKFDQTMSPAKDEYSASGANSTELGVRTKASDNSQTSCGELVSAAPVPEQAPVAGGLASFLARGQALPEKPSEAAPVHYEQARQVGLSAEMVAFGGVPVSRVDLSALQYGVRNADGDTAYFLPSFVEDPWEKLLSHRT